VRQASESLPEPLTESETRVLRLLATDLSKQEIGNELYVSVNTVKTHVKHVYAKLDVRTRRQAVQRARALGLLTYSSRNP
jgi:LuxR family maltose regulon positive regulatory protein